MRGREFYSTGNPDIYGFLEPQNIQRTGNKKIDTQTYIQRLLSESRKRIYFTSIIHACVSFKSLYFDLK